MNNTDLRFKIYKNKMLKTSQKFQFFQKQDFIMSSEYLHKKNNLSSPI